MTRLDKVIFGTALAVWMAVGASALVACTGRVRPGIGFSNDGTRVGMDLGEYDTAVAHPVTGEAPSEACPGGVCGVPDPYVKVRQSQVNAAQRALAPSRGLPTWALAALVGVVMGGVVWVLARFTSREPK